MSACRECGNGEAALCYSCLSLRPNGLLSLQRAAETLVADLDEVLTPTGYNEAKYGSTYTELLLNRARRIVQEFVVERAERP